MSFLEVIDAILIKPLELLFEVVYVMADKIVGNPGLSIVVLSLFMNFLVLPLYMRADEVQEEERAIEKKLQMGVAHIKKTFRGDERMMMLQTYYRQNNYKPVYVLRSAISLLLQIPFFVAAYRFLSNLQLLKGVSFGPIADLGSPDAMLQIGGATLHALPIIMTAVNLVTCLIFAKGSSLKEKIQLYAMALFFLVFLYDSPAGLVFYWTLNNVFSLGKTCFYKMKNPGKAVGIACSMAGGIILAYGILFYGYGYNIVLRKAFLAGCGLLLQMPIFLHGRKGTGRKKGHAAGENRKTFFTGALFLAVLTGILIPSAVIKTSPQEFVDFTCVFHPLWFVASAFCMAFGLFVLWTGVFYVLAKPSGKACFEKAVWIFSGVALMDYLFFGRHLGNLNSRLVFDRDLQYADGEILTNMVLAIVIASALFGLYQRMEKLAAEMLLTGMLTLSVMGIVNILEINRAVGSLDVSGVEHNVEIPEFALSRSEKNVIILMLDRAVGTYIPYLIQEKPELKEKLTGFTYYANTVSFGRFTNFSTPSLFGGYEYTPAELNRRDQKSLGKKQDEALSVLPVLFDKNGYNVTVCDPPYAGYALMPDLSIYEEHPDIKSYITEGIFTDSSVAQQGIRRNKRNFFCYGMLKVLPAYFQRFVYAKGTYNQTELDADYGEQIADSLDTATGISSFFMAGYHGLESLPDRTKVLDRAEGAFLMLTNNTTHFPSILQEPDYVPAVRVSNILYDQDHSERFTVDGKTLRMEMIFQMAHYQTNMATLLKLGEWFDYMREEGVYDNTRIILVSDHGERLFQREDLMLEDGTDIMAFYPLLMVKDFGSLGFEISEEFMTCADTPALAVDGLIESPVNPFTGKEIGNAEKTAHAQYIFNSDKSNIYENHGTQFLPGDWYAVRDDMRKPENWMLVGEGTVLPSVEDAEVKTGQGK